MIRKKVRKENHMSQRKTTAEKRQAESESKSRKCTEGEFHAGSLNADVTSVINAIRMLIGSTGSHEIETPENRPNVVSIANQFLFSSGSQWCLVVHLEFSLSAQVYPG